MIKKKTGELMFQFDDDEPQHLEDIYDFEMATFAVQQIKDGNSFIGFEKNNKKFKIFIKNL